MKYKWLDDYCLAKKGASKDFQPEWEAFRFFVGGKIFVIRGGDREKNAIVTLKCEPLSGQLLRSQYRHIVPGYHMNKEHWNSVYMDGDVPDGILKQMIDMSYDLVLNSLTKKEIKKINV